MRTRMRTLAVPALILLIFVFVTASTCGCGEPGKKTDTRDNAENGKEPDGGDKSHGGGTTTEVTLFFRYETPERSWLAAEKREVDAAEPCRAAMSALISGPMPGSGLKPVLPDTVSILGVTLEGGVCTVDLSKEVLTDANKVGASATSEMLALAAIADTLTGIQGVEKVRVLVEGQQSGMVEGRFVEDFWGHVGLPEFLERNEEVIFKES